MEKIIIVAMAANRIIGKNNTTPWHIPDELLRFKQTTMGHTLIMGRKTYEAIGHPLPGRDNIIITHNPDLVVPGCQVVHSLEEAFAVADPEKKAFIIGGGEIYEQSLPITDTVLLTLFDWEVEGDTTFPPLPAHFKETERLEVEGDTTYSIITYRKTEGQGVLD